MKISKRLVEDTEFLEATDAELEDALADEIEDATGIDNVEIVTDKNKVEDALDTAYAVAKRAKRSKNNRFVNPMLVGLGGVGKTEIVYSWCAKHGIKVVKLTTSAMDPATLSGLPGLNRDTHRADSYRTSVLDELDDGPCILFLDEVDKASKGVQGTLLTLINDHLIPDQSAEGGQYRFEQLLFCVGAVNHPDKLLPELKSRFSMHHIKADNIQVRNHLVNKYNDLAKKALLDAKADPEQAADYAEDARVYKGISNLANTLLSNPRFSFDDAEEQDTMYAENPAEYTALDPRSLEAALVASDGTKDGLLRVWDSNCNYKKHKQIEDILKNYVEVDDKANDALKSYSPKGAFAKKEKSAFDKLSDMMD